MSFLYLKSSKVNITDSGYVTSDWMGTIDKDSLTLSDKVRKLMSFHVSLILGFVENNYILIHLREPNVFTFAPDLVQVKLKEGEEADLVPNLARTAADLLASYEIEGIDYDYSRLAFEAKINDMAHMTLLDNRKVIYILKYNIDKEQIKRFSDSNKYAWVDWEKISTSITDGEFTADMRTAASMMIHDFKR